VTLGGEDLPARNGRVIFVLFLQFLQVMGFLKGLAQSFRSKSAVTKRDKLCLEMDSYFPFFSGCLEGIYSSLQCKQNPP